MQKKMLRVLLAVMLLAAMLVTGIPVQAVEAVSPAAALRITKQPQSVTVPEGQRAKVTVVATGEGLKYQWYYKETGSDKFILTTTYTTAEYSVPMKASRSGRQLYCVVTDKYGNSVKTDVVTIAMTKSVTITKQPVSVAVASGATAKVTVSATGDGLTYKWYYKNPGADKFSYTSTFAGNTYHINAMTAARSGRQVYCVITDKYGNSVQTNTVTITMGNKVSITKQPGSVMVSGGQTAKVTVSAAGDGLTYKWYYKNTDGSKFSLTNSFTGPIYEVEMSDSRNGRQLYCVVTDKYGNSVQTNTVTITMGNKVSITKQPVSVMVSEGQTAKVTVSATGDGLTYKWYYKNADGSKFSLTTKFTGPTYEVEMSDSRNGRQLYCVVTDKYGNSVQTNTVTITMGNKVSITKQPVSVMVPGGQTAKVTVSAAGDGLTYKWYFKDSGASKFSLTNSFTGPTYKVEMSDSRNGRQVYCVVTDKYGNSVQTNTVTLTKDTKLTITKQPVSVTVEEGQIAKVTVSATGDGLTYKWYFKNADSSQFSLTTSYTGASYSVKLNANRNGRQVYCVITDRYGNSVTTDTVTLSMKRVYTITADLGNGESLDVSVGASGKYVLPVPQRLGYEFQSWVDSNGKAFPASGTITKDTTIQAVWKETATKTLEDLIKFTDAGVESICISADILVDKPIFISYATKIFADGDYTLRRAPGYSGDIFVVGTDRNGVAAILQHRKAILTLGGGKGTLAIDGNRDNIEVKVMGSAVYVSDSATVNLYDGIRIMNNLKLGNDRVLGCVEFASLEGIERAGGAAILIANGVVNMYGGSLENNEVVTEAITVTGENGASWISETNACGGAVYNRGDFRMYGGVIKGSKALRGGAIYNDEIIILEAGLILDSVATTYGGAISSSGSSDSQIFIGSEGEGAEMRIERSTSGKAGGAIYSNTSSPIVIYGNTVLAGNHSDSIGGAIYTGGALTVRNTKFENNSSVSMGGAIYHNFSNPSYDRRDLEVVSSLFSGNVANYGGAIALGAAETAEEGTYAIIRDCTFDSNKATTSDGTSGNGGAIYVASKSEATVTNSIFSENEAAVSGGAVSLHSGAVVTLKDCNMDGNSALYGGAINISGDAQLTINGGIMNGNSASYGGAVFANPSKLTVKNVIFTKNTASSSGGAMCLQGAEVKINGNTRFEENSASAHAGGIYVTNIGTTYTKLTMTDGSFVSNTAATGGAASVREGSEATFTGTAFKDNISSGTGGAISNNGGIVTMKNVTVTGNKATYGGALYVGGTVILETESLTGNSATNGGAVYLAGGDLTLKVQSISGNTAENGGAIYADTGKLTLNGISFEENTATYGGAIFANPAVLEVKDSKFLNNSATASGGALYLQGTEVTVTGASEFKNNEAANRGAAVYMTVYGETVSKLNVTDGLFEDNTALNSGAVNGRNGSEVSFTNTAFKNNTATGANAENYKNVGGGAVNMESGKLTLSGVTMDGNASGNYGGAVMINGGSLLMNDSSVINSSGSTGAALYLYGCTTMDVTDSTISNNKAAWNGAVYCSAGTLNITNVVAENNSADQGAAFYLSGGDATLKNVAMTGNEAVNGGALYVGGTVILETESLTGNSATNGGAVYLAGGDLTLKVQSISGNTAENGGAIYADTGKLTLNGISFEENTATYGGAIFANPAVLEVKDSKFLNNSATASGGALYLQGTEVTVTGASEFKNNEAANRGAAVYMTVYGETVSKLNVTGGLFEDNTALNSGAVNGRNGSEVSFTNTAFKNNTATGANAENYKNVGGGAVNMEGGKLTLSGVTMDGNASGNYGGAVMINGGSLLMNDSSVINSSGSTGAALYLYGCTTMDVTDSTISNNTAVWNGAVYCSAGTLNITNVVAENNSANHGAAFYLSGGTVNLTNVTATGNVAKENGGAVYAGGATITMTGCEMTGNNAKYGGAIHMAGGSLTLAGGKFENNTAIENGGFLNIDAGTVTTSNTVTANGNKANKGGAVYVTNGTQTLSLNASGNSAPNGGAIYIKDGTVTLDGGSYNKNTVTGNGGAVMIAAGKLIVNGTSFAENTAGSGASGGAIYANTAEVEVKDATFTGNTAGYGGAMSLNGAVTTITGNTVFESNTAAVRGGAMDVTQAVEGKVNVTMQGGSFQNNEAPTGGAVYLRTNCEGIFTGTGFTDNKSTDPNASNGKEIGGGAIYGHAGTKLTLSGVTMDGNSSSNYGGAVMINGGSLLMNGSSVINSSGSTGAALYLYGCTTMDVTDSTISNNKAVWNGAVYCSAGTLNITNVVAENNSANHGAAFYLSGGTVNLTNVTATGNVAKENGGAVYAGGATITMTGCEMTGNNAKYGGAIHMAGGSLTLAGGKFENNTAIENGGFLNIDAGTATTSNTVTANGNKANKGGAVYVTNGTQTLSLNASGNSAPNGGAIYIKDGTVTLDGGSYNKNTVTGNGGAVMIAAGKLIVNGTSFAENTAGSGASGGAIYANTAEVEVKDATFTGNTAGYGGAMSLNGAVTTITGNTVFESNTAAVRGGAMDVTQAVEGKVNVTMQGGSFQKNEAPTGGAVYLRTNCEGIFTGTSFTGNKSTDPNASNGKEIGGGAIYGHAGTKLTLSGVTMDGNASGNYGGAVMINGGSLLMNDSSVINSSGSTGAALYLYGCTTMDVTDSTISNNTAVWNGAVYCSAGTLNITNVVAENNSANQGAAFYLSGGTANLTNVTATGNVAKENGGAVYAGGATITMTGCEMTGNNAKYGGAIHMAGGSLTLAGGKFENNTAIENGGFLNIDAGTVTTSNTVTANGNKANKGGAVYVTNGTQTLSLNASGNSAPNGGAIYIKDGTVTLDGGSYNKNTVTGNGGAVMIAAGKLIVNGTSFAENTAGSGASGGAIYANTAEVEVKDATFSGNTAGYGGAMSLNGAVTTITGNTVFESNTAAVRGGAMDVTQAVEGKVNVTMQGGSFQKNEAPTGGAVYLRTNCEGIFTGTSFTGNKSTDPNASNGKEIGGGAIYGHTGTKLTLSGVTMDGNTSAKYGGAVQMYQGTLNVSGNSEFKKNTALTHGAALYLYTTTAEISDSSFVENEATWKGVIYIGDTSNVMLTNVTATGNKADQGGLLCLVDQPTVTLTNVTATGNSAKTEGGVIYHYAWGGKLTISGGKFENNTTPGKGGAIWAGAKGPVEIKGEAKFLGNSAKMGGALYMDTSMFGTSASAANVTVSGNTVFEDNRATGGDGGAIYVADTTSTGTGATTLIMTDVILRNNKSYGKGGALSTDENSPNLVIKATGCTFEGNQAGYQNTADNPGGGAVEIQNGNAFSNGAPTALKLVFTNCTFTNNAGKGTGGAVDIRNASYAKFDGITATGNKSIQGWNGAVIYVTSEYSRLYLTGEVTVSNNTAGKADKFIYVSNAKGAFLTSHASTASWVSLIYSAPLVQYEQTMP